MHKFLTPLALTVLTLAPCAAPAQTMSLSMVGVGPHGYDFMIGSWSCTNSVPSHMGGPSTSSFTISRSANGALFIRTTAANYETASYAVYSAKTKTWWSPTAYADGSYNIESTRQTGAKSVWTGTFFDAASGKTTPIRDTFAFPNTTTQTDLTQVEIGGTWKTEADSTCTKS
jgi:hypothetical protein